MRCEALPMSSCTTPRLHFRAHWTFSFPNPGLSDTACLVVSSKEEEGSKFPGVWNVQSLKPTTWKVEGFRIRAEDLNIQAR